MTRIPALLRHTRYRYQRQRRQEEPAALRIIPRQGDDQGLTHGPDGGRLTLKTLRTIDRIVRADTAKPRLGPRAGTRLYRQRAGQDDDWPAASVIDKTS